MKWRVFLVFTIIAIIGGVWLIFSMVVPAPYGKVTLSVPNGFTTFLDNAAFSSGSVSAGKHVVEVRYSGLTLVKEDIYIKPEDNKKINIMPTGLLLRGPARSLFTVQTIDGLYHAKGNYLWLPGFSGEATVMINGKALPLNVAKSSFVGFDYDQGSVVPLYGVYYQSVPMQSTVTIGTSTITMPAIVTASAQISDEYSLDGNILVLTPSLSTGSILRTATDDFSKVKIVSDTSMLAFSSTTVSQYNVEYGWRVWSVSAPEKSGSWYKSGSGFVFYGNKVWAYKDNGAWLWVHEAPGQLVDVEGNYIVFQTKNGMIFWDFLTGEPVDSPKFTISPSHSEYLLGERYLYSSDGRWFSGVEVMDYSWNEKWLALVTRNHDIIILTR